LLTGEEMSALLRLARQGVEAAVLDHPPGGETACEVPRRLTERHGCFVTLWLAGELRGCIGNVLPREPLHRMILANARAAALTDPRFPPVTPTELPRLTVEVSVLTEPQHLVHSGGDDLLRRLVPRRDGVFLQIGAHSATFLPQVWSQLPEPRRFLDRLAQKAGCSPEAWQLPEARVLVYRAQWLAEDQPEARDG
jgi:hypothetical protein